MSHAIDTGRYCPRFVDARFVIAKAGLITGLIIGLLIVQQAVAVEIHSFLLPNCRIENGIVVNMGESSATMIDLSGQPKSIEIKSIRAVFVSSAGLVPATLAFDLAQD